MPNSPPPILLDDLAQLPPEELIIKLNEELNKQSTALLDDGKVVPVEEYYQWLHSLPPG